MPSCPDRPAEPSPLVLIVDDDAGVREAIASLLRSVSLDVLGFATARAMIEAGRPDRPCCVILDVRLPEMSGLEAQALLEARGEAPPVIFLTGHADIPMTVQAMKAGASDFLTKPARDQDLLDAVAAALDVDRARRRATSDRREAAARADGLTARERQVMEGVVRGLMNKQIAGELGISEITVKLHRGAMMRKLGTRTTPDLVRLAGALGAGEAGAA